MNKILKYSVFGVLVAGFCVGMHFLERATLSGRPSLTCTDLEVQFKDSLEFVSGDDVRECISNIYGPFLGKQLDSIALGRIEEILEAQSAVRKSEAWVTDDGTLHIAITQRAPVVRFQNGESGFYVDDRGFIFPLHPRYTADVPLVEGAIPVEFTDGFKGEARTEAERLWIREMIDFTGFVNGSDRWNGFFSTVRVKENGDLELRPAEGEETFIFGPPHSIAEKFDRVDRYYSYILPAKGNCYRTINIKYKNQIICRTKDM